MNREGPCVKDQTCSCCHLTYILPSSIGTTMRITVTIDDQILKRASDLSGVKDKTVLVKMGLEVLSSEKAPRDSPIWVGPRKSCAQSPEEDLPSRMFDTGWHIYLGLPLQERRGPCPRWIVWQAEAEPPRKHSQAEPGNEYFVCTVAPGILPVSSVPAGCRCYWRRGEPLCFTYRRLPYLGRVPPAQVQESGTADRQAGSENP